MPPVARRGPDEQTPETAALDLAALVVDKVQAPLHEQAAEAVAATGAAVAVTTTTPRAMSKVVVAGATQRPAAATP